MTGQQLSIFDVLVSPAVILDVDPDGPVIQGDIDELLALPHPRMAWDQAWIELHRHVDGLWMWATCWNWQNAGSGYRVGPKWGNFAQTRDDALYYAKQELRASIDHRAPEAAPILAWLEALS